MYQAGHKDQIRFLLSRGSEDENRVNPGQRGQGGSQQQQAGSVMLWGWEGSWEMSPGLSAERSMAGACSQ